ncbi:hypothetical protein [Primorskyibacter sp. 2E233]|uniref:hypothetical protein n=1 Tax=Primorskyibacter sp. 2E233 TaxID=3413431 RepID=UPI003BF3175C
MITMEDVEGMTSLSHEEIAAVAEHENLPDLDAACYADYLMHQHHGAAHVQQLICEDIRAALHRDDVPRAKELYAVLHHFLSEHPDAARGSEA